MATPFLNFLTTSNSLRQTYVTGFLDTSGGDIITRNGNIYLLSGDILASNRLLLSRDASMNSRLFLGGDASLGGRLFIKTDLSVNGRMFLGKDASMNGQLFLAGDASLSGRLFVTNDLSVNGRMFLGKDASMNGQLFLAGDASLSGRLFVTNDLSVNGRLFLGKDASMNGQLFLAGDASLSGRLFVTNDLSVNGRLFLGKDASMNGKMFLAGDASLSGRLFINNDLSVNGQLFLGQDASMNGKMFLAGDASLSGRLFVKNDLSVNGQLFLGKDASMNGKMFLAGDASLSGRLFINNDLSVNGRLFLGKDASMNGKMFLAGDASLSGRLFVKNDLSVNGQLFLGGDASLGGSLSVGNLNVLGSVNFQPGSININSLLGSGATTGIFPGNVSVGSPLYSIVSGTIVPVVNTYNNYTYLTFNNTTTSYAKIEISFPIDTTIGYIVVGAGNSTNTTYGGVSFSNLNSGYQLKYKNNTSIIIGVGFKGGGNAPADYNTVGFPGNISNGTSYINYTDSTTNSIRIYGKGSSTFGNGNGAGFNTSLNNLPERIPTSTSDTRPIAGVIQWLNTDSIQINTEILNTISPAQYNNGGQVIIYFQTPGNLSVNGSINNVDMSTNTGTIKTPSLGTLAALNLRQGYTLATIGGNITLNSNNNQDSLITLPSGTNTLASTSSPVFSGNLTISSGNIVSPIANTTSFNFFSGDTYASATVQSITTNTITLISIPTNISLGASVYIYNGTTQVPQNLVLTVQSITGATITLSSIPTRDVTGYTLYFSNVPIVSINNTGDIYASSYNSTSDYRIKDNVQSLDSSITVDGLNPVSYINKISNKPDIGFLAHEVQDIYPFMVSGERDGDKYQTLNYVSLIGILVKEIKLLKQQNKDILERLYAAGIP